MLSKAMSWSKGHRRLAIPALISALMVALLLGGCGFPWASAAVGGKADGQGAETAIDPTPATDEVVITLYFADHQVQHVVPEERRVALGGQDTLAHAAVAELLKGPQDPYLAPVFPDGTELVSVEVQDGVAHVNFAAGLHIQGTAGQMMAINGLVYTLTGLDGVDQVQVLVGGRTLNFEGHMVFTDPVDRGPILTYPIFIDEERVAWLQQEVDQGRQTWRQDPDAVVQFDSRMAGFTGQETFAAVASGDPGIMLYRVETEDGAYMLELLRADRQNPDSIWLLVAVDAL